MKIFLISIFILVILSNVSGQNCPVGYSERNVMCNGKIEGKCIPENFECNSCWKIVWQKCNSNERGADNYASTYEDALKLVEERKQFFINSSCKTIKVDYNKASIFISNNKYCNSLVTNPDLISDLQNKIIPFLKRYRNEIANYRRYFNGQTYKPGAIYKEYKELLKQTENNVSKLSSKLDNINDINIRQIESEFENIKIESERLNKAYEELYTKKENPVKDVNKADTINKAQSLLNEKKANSNRNTKSIDKKPISSKARKAF